MGKKCDLSDFDDGMIVGARQGGLSVSKYPGIFTHSLQSRPKVLSQKSGQKW